MALTTYHHGITATETSNITPIIKSVSISTIALVSTSVDADDTKYPLDTPVLLTGITTDDVTKAGAKDALLSQCLQTIKSIQNTSVVVLRLSEPVDVTTVDTLLSCQSRLGITPKIFIAPEIDTPTMTRKLVEIAKKRRGFVYASPRMEDGSLITAKEDIVAYRDTFAARELMLIENEWGVPGKSQPSDGGSSQNTVGFLKFQNDQQIDSADGNVGGLVYSINGGEMAAIKSTISEAGFSTMYAFFPEIPTGDVVLPLGRDGGGGRWNDAYMPNGLDVNNFYWFGLNNIALQEYFAFRGFSIPDRVVQGEVEITVYPASKLPSANIDYDIFDLIIDPSIYTTSELAHFAEWGITPAVKNPDGSYTIKSQLTLPPPEQPPLQPPSDF
ncbi:hypothetical protein [Psychrobacter sp. HII-4]|uniref:hypothetical protein n=1 Tax=Psychrobacter sp. HII-4 TaxID=1569264 RepID=UPI0019196664|nr:hypothetical protein [Psychrobacter sp. HII-4]